MEILPGSKSNIYLDHIIHCHKKLTTYISRFTYPFYKLIGFTQIIYIIKPKSALLEVIIRLLSSFYPKGKPHHVYIWKENETKMIKLSKLTTMIMNKKMKRCE